MAQGVSGQCLKISKKIFLTFLGLGTNVVKVSSVNSEILFQWDTLIYIYIYIYYIYIYIYIIYIYIYMSQAWKLD